MTPLRDLFTPAVKLAMSFSARITRDENGNASPAADLAAWSLLRGSESIQNEIDRYLAAMKEDR